MLDVPFRSARQLAADIKKKRITPGGLPVGLEIDGPVGSDAKLLGLGLSIEGILGSAPPPKA